SGRTFCRLRITNDPIWMILRGAYGPFDVSSMIPCALGSGSGSKGTPTEAECVPGPCPLADGWSVPAAEESAAPVASGIDAQILNKFARVPSLTKPAVSPAIANSNVNVQT